MSDFLDTLAQEAEKRVSEGYYTEDCSVEHGRLSLREAVLKEEHAPVIAEIKRASPSQGVIREDGRVTHMARILQEGGAIALSVLTEPNRFKGCLEDLANIREIVDIPLLMKDIILSTVQVDAASIRGADAILLVKAIFNRGYCEQSLGDMVRYAHSQGMEVLLECHTPEEFASSVKTEVDLVGINNRDLRTLKVEINTTTRILKEIDPKDKLVVSESGIKEASQIRMLHNSGAQAFLIGSSIMRSKDMRKIVEELVSAI